AAALEERGPFVLVELDESTLPAQPIDGQAEQRRTGLYVQSSIATDEEAFRPSPRQLAWEVGASGTQATGVAAPRFELIALLQPLPLPDADLSRETLVAIFQGRQPTGGYSVQARRVSEEQGELYVDVEFVEPAPGAATTQAVTSPWTLVRVLRSGYPVAWIRDVSDGTLVGVARRTE